jgi:hypothetical protein
LNLGRGTFLDGLVVLGTLTKSDGG